MPAPADERSPIERVLALSQLVEEDLLQTRAELKKVPVLIRPMATGSFKNKAGRSVAEWIERMNELSGILGDEDEPAAEQLNSRISDLAESLDQLRTYYLEAPEENAKNIRDEQVRQEMAAQMAKREADVAELIAAIVAIPRQ
jgi:hypothetical protein